MKANKNSPTLRRIIKYIKPHLAFVVFTLLLSLISVGLTLYVPLLIGDAVDLAVSAGNVNVPAIVKIIFTVIICVGLTALAQWLIGITNNKITFSVTRSLRRDAFGKLQKLPVSYIDSVGHGALLSRIISDVDVFSDGLLMGFTQLFSGVLTILGTLVFMLAIDVKITLLVVILTPGSILISKFIATSTFKMFREQAEAREAQTSIIEEVISSEKTVKAFGVEQRMTVKFDIANEKLQKASLGAVFYSSLVNPSTRFFNSVIYAVVVLIGALSVAGSGALTVGLLTCILGYVNQYTKPFNEISGVIAEFQNALACAGRIFELLDRPSEAEKENVNEKFSVTSGDVSFSHVKFSYTPEKTVINDFNLEVKAGQTVAIVGTTGCGKTTLINLLMRFYDIDEGEITIDGTRISDITRTALRKNSGMVLQDTWLKHGTVAENIALGSPEASKEEIIAAAKAVHAHSFIKRLPQGYDTVVGEGGLELSQGQRQLISIARVMLSPPSILILDEATSSIDIRTEALIQSAFDKLTKGRTSFVIAHRLSTVRNADVIAVMNDGGIVEKGTHDELLEKGGLYSSIYNSQFLREA